MRPILLLYFLGAGCLAQEPVPTFGTTVVIPSGLQGVLYFLKRDAPGLPDFAKLNRQGILYTTSLNVPPQSFRQGFPGVNTLVNKRFEWFAIDYTGKFWIEKPGRYSFRLTSDDGAMLEIDDQLIADNDGIHPPSSRRASIVLARGIHRIHVPYCQGPGDKVALILEIAGPGEELRVFSTDEFKPPPNPETWNFSERPKSP